MIYGEREEEVIKISIITINYNGERFLEETIRSVLSQASPEIDLEYIIVDGGSTDRSLQIIEQYRSSFSHVISEPDSGPANALNKGFKLASGQVIAWLNADDCYFPNTLQRVAEGMRKNPNAAFCFGRCPIINEKSEEIRKGITCFKELFFPFSSHFTYRCINYISQPALFFRREAFQRTGFLDETMVAAWDYKFVLGLWQHGPGVFLKGPPLARFRWHEHSISGRNFAIQFKEEYEAIATDAGRYHPASMAHFMVRWLIVGVYSVMAMQRRGQ
ncbi:MAG: glycosyltransferase [Desulfobulbaceae bacterium]|nr:glycosyltransferase [Desulfobulbaceae bacterium]